MIFSHRAWPPIVRPCWNNSLFGDRLRLAQNRKYQYFVRCVPFAPILVSVQHPVRPGNWISQWKFWNHTFGIDFIGIFTHQISESDLGRCFIVFVGDAFDAIIEHVGRRAGVSIRMPQRTEASDRNIPFFAEFRQFPLIYSWWAFHLIHDRRNFRNRKNARDLFAIEIRHTDAFHQTKLHAPLHCRPRFQIIDVAECTTAIGIAWPLLGVILVGIAKGEMNQK